MHEPGSRSNDSHLGNNMTKNDNEKGKDDHIFDLDSTSDKHLLNFTKTLLSHKGRIKDAGAMIHATLERTLLRVVSALNADIASFEKEETSGSGDGKGSNSKSIVEKNSLFSRRLFFDFERGYVPILGIQCKTWARCTFGRGPR